MDTPHFTTAEQAGTDAPSRPLWRRFVCLLRKNWGHAVVIAAAPGGAWLIGGLVMFDAVVLGARASSDSSELTLISAVAGFPFHLMRGHGCRTGAIRDWMVARRDPQGVWSILPCTNMDEYQDQLMLNYDETLTFDTATVKIGQPSASSIGIWSPLISRELGRKMTVRPLDPKFTAADETAVRAAAVASWSNPANHSVVYSSPLNPVETAAALAGSVPSKHTLRWPAVANDVAVAGLLSLLVASQPRRAKRWHARREALAPRVRLTHCPTCRYDLIGLTTDSYGDRTCPECGRVCGQFF